MHYKQFPKTAVLALCSVNIFIQAACKWTGLLKVLREINNLDKFWDQHYFRLMNILNITLFNFYLITHCLKVIADLWEVQPAIRSYLTIITSLYSFLYTSSQTWKHSSLAISKSFLRHNFEKMAQLAFPVASSNDRRSAIVGTIH